eukprot:1395285-Amorphochlora_amoeboformis.AAC.1
MLHIRNGIRHSPYYRTAPGHITVTFPNDVVRCLAGSPSVPPLLPSPEKMTKLHFWTQGLTSAKAREKFLMSLKTYLRSRPKSWWLTRIIGVVVTYALVRSPGPRPIAI